MMQAMDQGAIEGATDVASDRSGAIGRAMDGASDGSGSSSRSNGWCEQLIREQ